MPKQSTELFKEIPISTSLKMHHLRISYCLHIPVQMQFCSQPAPISAANDLKTNQSVSLRR
jgi:hypothetical protein